MPSDEYLRQTQDRLRDMHQRRIQDLYKNTLKVIKAKDKKVGK